MIEGFLHNRFDFIEERLSHRDKLREAATQDDMAEVPRPAAERPSATGQEGNRNDVFGFPWATAVPFSAGLKQVPHASGVVPAEVEVQKRAKEVLVWAEGLQFVEE